jgi:sterol desaturase/sphingolipid hydroxylase (fatty acid hydroxylase superfamily)
MPIWLSAALVLGEVCCLLWLERRWPLRQAVESKLRRNGRNFAVAAISAIAVQLAERPFILPLAELVDRNELGLLSRFSMPKWLEVFVAAGLMDYTLYVWHVLVHRVPWLWRMHLVHHVDLDLDASTALRFHFAELVVSVPWRAGQIALIGVSPLSLSVWQTLLMLSILFHHSNVKLPIGIERWLSRFIVTPRMHGIHHSIIRDETNSNWSSGLTLWDWLHRTLRLNVPQQEVTIGVPAYRNVEEVAYEKIMSLPFRAQRSTWQLPDDGEPKRERITEPKNHLAA